MKNAKIHSFILLSLMILLTACTNQNHQKSSISDITDEYTVPANIPTPSSGKGSVIGQIITRNPQDLRGLLIYLGGLVKLPNNMYGAALNSSEDPSSLISIHDGRFYISDVDPGMYSLIIYEVMAGGKVYQDSNGSAIPVSVVDGEITDVGTIEFNLSGEK